MKKEIEALVVAGLQDIIAQSALPALQEITAQTVIFADEDAALDSMGLVTLIAELEERVYETFGQDIILASERAMSRRRSPFRTVDSLAAYTEELLQEAGA